MDFNFGQSTDFGSTGSSELIVSEGESALFNPGELEMDVDFSKGQELETPTPEKPVAPTKTAKPKAAAKPAEQPKEEEVVKSPFELEVEEATGDEDDEDPEGLEDPAGDEDEDPDYNPYKEYAEDMFSAGILTPQEGDDQIDFSDEKVLQARFEKEKYVGAQKIVDNFLTKFGPKHVEAFNKIFVEGVDPDTYYRKASRIENLDKANLEDVVVQENIIRAYLSHLGWNDEDISTRVNKIKEYDDLANETKVAHKALLKVEQDELAASAVQNQQKANRELQNTNMYNAGIQQGLTEAISKKELGGIPVNKETAARVFDMMSNKRWNVEGKTFTTFERMLEDLKDPRNVELALKVALLYDNKFDFAPIKKKAISEETNTLFNSIKRKQTTQRRGRTGKSSSDNWSI